MRDLVVLSPEKSLGDLKSVYKCLMNVIKRMEPGSLQWCLITRQETMGTNWNTGIPTETEETGFFCRDGCICCVVEHVLGGAQNLDWIWSWAASSSLPCFEQWLLEETVCKPHFQPQLLRVSVKWSNKKAFPSVLPFQLLIFLCYRWLSCWV